MNSACRIIFSLFFLIVVSLIVLPFHVQSSQFTVKTELEDTKVVDYMAHDAYTIHSEDSKFEAKVSVVDGGNVDFYLFDEEQYKQYKSYFSFQFEYTDEDENANKCQNSLFPMVKSD